MTTEAQKNARNKYNKEHYRVITLNFRKEHLSPYQQFADARGITLSQAIITLAELQLGIRKMSLFQRLRFVLGL